ncbi:protein Niban-like [Parambassis ranga]|uniref:Protein Niban-like n=1 Tax=Parambassis ranga TaxID=210632 RepID=A0A6P7I3L2_9TELE|nr:protein Niban-like [Parambassis ranga]
MGVSASSLLDETRSNYIRDQAEAELRDFSPYYRKQFSVARFCQVEDELEPNKQKITQLLKQKPVPKEGKVLYEDSVLYFDDARKWRERYVVVRANYCLECHDSLETFVKGVPPRHKLLPTGGTVLTTEESYMAMVDKCFPDDSSAKEDFAPPLTGMPGQFPVYLRLPYRRDWYFCFKEQATQAVFLSILTDCIRHQNQDFLKKKTCEVLAFLKAVQLYRQDKGKYEAWDMLIGSDVRVMANVVMEQLLPSLGKDLLPRLKAKKTERKRVWFAAVEAAYILVQEHLLVGLSALKEECLTSVRQQEVLIHSDMDQILTSRKQLEGKIRAKVSEPAERLCSESIQPYLGSVLDELMEPISSGFQEGRQLSESQMDQVCRDVLQGLENEAMQALADMARPNLLSCYQKISSLQDKLQSLQERFSFSNISGVIHSAQIDLQQLMENAACTFEQLLHKAVQDNPDSAGSATEKAKHRVLKQYDYDSSTVRKRIFQEALVSITLPFIKKNLAPTCSTELQGLEQSIDADHSNFIHVENVYESILLQILDKEVSKVVKEAASLKKHNLFTDSRDLISQSSRSSLCSPSASTPSSPSSPAKTSPGPQQPSPLALNGLLSSPQKQEEEEVQQSEEEVQQSAEQQQSTEMETPLGKAEVKEAAPSDAARQEAEPLLPKDEDVSQTVKEEEGSTGTPETPTSEDKPAPSETQDAAAAPETVIQEEVTSVQSEEAEPETQTPGETCVSEPPAAAAETTNTRTEGPKNPPEGPGPQQTADSTEEEVQSAVPSGGDAPAELKEEAEAEPVTVSDPNSLDVSVGSESDPSDLESTDEVSTTSDVLEDEGNVSKSPVSSDDPAEERAMSKEPSPPAQDASSHVGVGSDVEAGASVSAETPAEDSAVSLSASSPDTRPPDCIKEIRDLVVEVIEVEELVQRYPSGVPTEE